MRQSFKNTILEEAISWIESGQQVALATVVETWGSSPFQIGSKMVINGKGNFLGSVSGGCVETSVITECLELIKNKNFKEEIFFNKKELGEILNIYGAMVSKGEWKDYAIFINKNIVGFDIYRKATEKPLFQIIKSLKSKVGQKYQLKDQYGKVIKYSDEIKNIISVLYKRKIRLIKWKRKNTFQKKFLKLATELLLGEKNGKKTGWTLSIVQKNAQIKNPSLTLLLELGFLKTYLLWPKSLNNIINKLMKSRYNVKAPITAFFDETSVLSLSKYMFLIFWVS